MHPRRSKFDLRGSEDAGFAIVEILVSAVLLIAFALATLTLLDQSSKHSGTNRSRAVASTLAEADQAEMRQLPMSRFAGGYSASATKSVDGVSYTVTSSARWSRDAGGAVTCTNGSGQVAYLRTRTAVTWPGMTTRPVVLEGILAPGVRALGANAGALVVLLSRADGSGLPGITVNVGGVSATTDDDGCAVLGNVAAGSQTLSYGADGYVDQDGVSLVSTPVTIAPQATGQKQDAYDLAGAVDVELVDQNDAPVSWPSITAEHAQRPSGALKVPRVNPTDGVITAGGLFPFPSPYNIYAGGCGGNDPTAYPGTYTASSVRVTPGSRQTLTGRLQRVLVTVRDSSNAPLTTVGLAAYPETTDPKMAGCTEVVQRQVVASTNGQYTITLPFGVWRICADQTVGTRRARVLTVAGSSPADDPIVNTPAQSNGAYAPRLSTTLRVPSTSGGGTLCP